MNFRECRMRSMHEVFKQVDETISIEKTFLLLGGIRNGMYVFNAHGNPIIGLSGCYEINCPGVFELLSIDYTTIEPKAFVEVYESANNKEENVYIIPAIREILNTDTVDMSKVLYKGHSYFVVDRIDETKIYFKCIDDTSNYYLDIKLFNSLNNDSHWIMESGFDVYQLNIEQLKHNKSFQDLMTKTEKELLIDNIQKFLINEKMVGDEGTVRFDGEQVYDEIANHMQKMLVKLETEKGTENYKRFIKYVYLQLVNFRKLVSSGSDGYYRTEFYEILSHYEIEASQKERWEQIIWCWRNFGRRLAQVASLKYLEADAIGGLNMLISAWEQIKKLEIETMKALKI